MKDTQKLRGGPGFEPPAHAPNAAMLIDFDNVTMGIRSDLQNQLKRLLASDIFKGKVSVQRAYADWRRYPQYIVPLSESSIDLIFAPAFGSNKKNATDIRLAIDATELVFTRPEIGTFILLSGDSDFSSLVLKLKEYGKYVIGVGIRESSSDLLIQNCDEYYSYSELTGLARESDLERPRRDPWELVVEAVTQMRRDRDVMRSDRLKQVMQEIDPNFDEGDVGFSRFSKFVQEASQRGLLTLTKMENGQYEIDLGSNANVSPAVESELAAAPSQPSRPQERRPRGRGGRDRVERAAAARGGATLAQAFDVLRLILMDLGATGDESTDADQVRERMVERFGAGDPIVDENRFRRLLRQAHDANLIELVKRDDDAYLLRLTAAGQEAGETGGQIPESPAAAEGDSAGERQRERRRGGRGRGGRGRRGERRPEGERPSRDETAGDSRADRAPSEAAPAATSGGGSSAEQARRSIRFRSGSRRPQPGQGPGAGAGTAAPQTAAAEEEKRPPASGPSSPAAAGTDSPRRSVRGRAGSRGGRRGGGSGSSEESPSRTDAPASGTDSTPPSRNEVPEPRGEQPVPAPLKPPVDETGKSLFQRLSGALQKALGGEPGE